MLNKQPFFSYLTVFPTFYQNYILLTVVRGPSMQRCSHPANGLMIVPVCLTVIKKKKKTVVTWTRYYRCCFFIGHWTLVILLITLIEKGRGGVVLVVVRVCERCIISEPPSPYLLWTAAVLFRFSDLNYSSRSLLFWGFYNCRQYLKKKKKKKKSEHKRR